MRSEDLVEFWRYSLLALFGEDVDHMIPALRNPSRDILWQLHSWLNCGKYAHVLWTGPHRYLVDGETLDFVLRSCVAGVRLCLQIVFSLLESCPTFVFRRY